jgi:hypothetical protein
MLTTRKTVHTLKGVSLVEAIKRDVQANDVEGSSNVESVAL